MSDVEHLPTVNETIEDNTPTPQPETSIPAIDSLAENDAVISEDEPTQAVITADTPTQPAEIFPLVGIGASAGGLAAFEAFFSGMPLTLTLTWPSSWCSTWPLTIRACSPS